jgi:hypothetical protein
MSESSQVHRCALMHEKTKYFPKVKLEDLRTNLIVKIRKPQYYNMALSLIGNK